jgi:hypothetical protein
MRTVGVWRRGAIAVSVVCCLTAFPQMASALEPGVHVDPGSPAAKEYALPLDQARQTGSESTSQQSSEGGLFGAGIKPPGSGGSPRGGRRGGGGSSGAAAGSGAAGPGTSGTGRGVTPAQGGANATPAAQAALAQAALRAAREQGSGGGSGSILALVGGGVAILVLGGFGGTVLRHSRRPRPSA